MDRLVLPPRPFISHHLILLGTPAMAIDDATRYAGRGAEMGRVDFDRGAAGRFAMRRGAVW